MRNTSSFAPPVALVTGGSRGLGRAIALGFGRAGYRVAVNYRKSSEEADESVQSIRTAGGEACADQTDIGDPEAVAAMISRIVARWGSLNVLVCNAAVTEDQLLVRLSEQSWERVVTTILTGTFHCLRATGAVMTSQGAGAILLIGSLAAAQGRMGQGAYAAAKAGLWGLMKSAAREWGASHICVNLIMPGWHASALTGHREDPTPPPFSPVLGHGTTMEGVARFAVALAGMRDVSGQVFNLDSRIALP
jgi:3-oxoacyl-[acyl-carrier protein] reductase